MQPFCYSIGHSNYALAEFMDMLGYHGVSLVVDVRSIPYSRFVPQYNREGLQVSLLQQGIRYLYAGKDLGGLECRREGDLEQVIQGDDFQAGIQVIMNRMAAGDIAAVMCAEKDPYNCHRFFLVSYALERKGVEVRHILEGGSAVPTGLFEQRLLDQYHEGLCQLSLFDTFDTRADVVKKAYSRHFREQPTGTAPIG